MNCESCYHCHECTDCDDFCLRRDRDCYDGCNYCLTHEDCKYE